MTSPNREAQMRKLITEFQLMQDTAETLEARLQMLQGALADLTVAIASVEALKDAEEGAPILVPTGSGTLVNARLGDLSKIIVNIGADVSINMTLEDAEKNMRERLEEVQKVSTSVQQQLQQVLSQMQVHQDVINRLGAGIRGEQADV